MDETRSRDELNSRFALALERLESCPEFARLIPEVRTNLVFARSGATGPEHVLAVDGRITVVEDRPRAAGRPRLGASDHMARLVIELARRDPSIRAGINFASTPRLVAWLEEYCQRSGWVFSVIDRSLEPEALQAEDRPSIPWKVEAAVHAAGGLLPKLFHETASPGKEPLTFLVGPDPVLVVDEVCAIAREWTTRVSPAYCTRWAPPPTATAQGGTQ